VQLLRIVDKEAVVNDGNETERELVKFRFTQENGAVTT
jgi:hypothetical protein